MFSSSSPGRCSSHLATLGFENLYGGDALAGDTLIGNARDNVIWGRAGNDNSTAAPTAWLAIRCARNEVVGSI